MKFCTLLTLVHLSHSTTPAEIFSDCQVHISEIEARGGNAEEIKRKRVECVVALNRVSRNIQYRLWQEEIQVASDRFYAANRRGLLVKTLEAFRQSNGKTREIDMSQVSDSAVTHIKEWITEEVCGPCLRLGEENINAADGKSAQLALRAGMGRVATEYADHVNRGEYAVFLKGFTDATAQLLEHYRGFEDTLVVDGQGITARLATINSLERELAEVQQYISQLSL
jgi:hypothetical protein